MERVKNILQRLQEVYYGKHQKSAIDIDLMLDYTRVMYADLLEWRREFKEPPTTEKAEPNPEVVTREAGKTTTTADQMDPPAAAPEAVVEKQDETPAAAPAPAAESAPAAADAAAPPDKAYVPVQHDEPAPKPPATSEEPPLIDTEPEKEYIEILQRDESGISFEPPAAPEVTTDMPEDLSWEQPAVMTAVEEIPAPPPAEIPLPEMAPATEKKTAPADLFTAAAHIPRDIRAAIGINDKYLFLNELFNNHKSNYEETLDQLNHFSSLQQAEDWIDTRVAASHKWDKSDPTVEGFYAVLQKHFSAR